jgi:resuscitation-promoting factor RpfA
MAEEGAQTPTDAAKGKKGKGGAFKKYKWWFIGGGAVLLGIIYVAIKKSNSNSAASTTGNPAGTATQSGINPATGYLYGSPADVAASGSSGTVAGTPGPAGATGATGATGAPGPAGAAGKTGATGKAGAPGKYYPPKGAPPIKSLPHPAPGQYIVKPGDTLSGIAAKFKVSGGWHTLYNLNKHTIGGNPNMIHPGQKLTL